VAQLWLRETPWDHFISYVRKSHLDEDERLGLIADIERVAKAQIREAARDNKYEKRIFHHFIYWGGWTASGYGRGVHPSSLAAEDQAEALSSLVAKARMMGAVKQDPTGALARAQTKERHTELLLEADVLQVEGKLTQARKLRKMVADERAQRRKEQLAGLKGRVDQFAGAVAKGIDALLDSDSEDEDEENDEGGAGRRAGSARQGGRGEGADSDHAAGSVATSSQACVLC
jgi:hypothetical protein